MSRRLVKFFCFVFFKWEVIGFSGCAFCDLFTHLLLLDTCTVLYMIQTTPSNPTWLFVFVFFFASSWAENSQGLCNTEKNGAEIAFIRDTLKNELSAGCCNNMSKFSLGKESEGVACVSSGKFDSPELQYKIRHFFFYCLEPLENLGRS